MLLALMFVLARALDVLRQFRLERDRSFLQAIDDIWMLLCQVGALCRILKEIIELLYGDLVLRI